VKAPAFTQIRPEEQTLSRVERNVATTLGAHAALLNGGLGLDNARGVLLEREVVAPLSEPVAFSLGKGAGEPVSLALVSLKSASGTRYSGGPLKWSWSTTQGIGQLLLLALPAEVDAGAYSLSLFVVGG
jgi:hypothetical protein